MKKKDKYVFKEKYDLSSFVYISQEKGWSKIQVREKSVSEILTTGKLS